MSIFLAVLWYILLTFVALIAIGGIVGGWLFLLLNIAYALEDRNKDSARSRP